MASSLLLSSSWLSHRSGRKMSASSPNMSRFRCATQAFIPNVVYMLSAKGRRYMTGSERSREVTSR